MNRYQDIPRADQYALRFPAGMRDDVKALAVANRRSMNAEIIFHLERALASSEAVGGGEQPTSTPPAAN